VATILTTVFSLFCAFEVARLWILAQELSDSVLYIGSYGPTVNKVRMVSKEETQNPQAAVQVDPPRYTVYDLTL
jgi:hypothetical protein